MAIAKAAVEKFLTQPLIKLPEFKYGDPVTLARSIYDSTGLPFNPLKSQPRPYQVEGVAFALWLRRALLFYDMRLGKTAMSLYWAEHLRRAKLFRKKGLVIAHSPLGLQVWEREADIHSDLKISVVHLDVDDFVNALVGDSDLIVVPVSGLQELFSQWGVVSRGTKKGQRKLYPNMELVSSIAEEFDLCIIDEIHMYGDHTSLRFQIAAGLTMQCNFRLGLTGTPIGRNPYKLWAQTFLIDRGTTLGNNYYFFEQAFGMGKPNWFSKRMQYKFDDKKLPLLKAKMDTVAMAYQRSEVVDQTVWTSVVELRMHGDQREAYVGVVNRLIKLRGQEDSVEILATFHRLRQVASGYFPFKDKTGTDRIVNFRSSPKLEWLGELVESDPGVQVIIFHDYTYSGQMICDLLTKHKQKFAWLYGGVTNLTKANQIIKNFQSGKIQYLVANAAKGGMSLDLPMTDQIVYFESPVSPITRQQSQARPMARGDRPLIIDDLVCSQVERRILEFYQENKDLSTALHGVRVRRSLID